jgi:hypothetical protein
MTIRSECITDRARSAIRATILLSALGLCLIGCASGNPTSDPPCDPAKRQQMGIASLGNSPTSCSSLMKPTTDNDH